MKRTTIKKLALVASAGVLFQLAGCTGLLFQVFSSLLLNQVLPLILDSVTGTVTDAGTGTGAIP